VEQRLFPAMSAPECVIAFMPEFVDVTNAADVWERLLGLIRAQAAVLIVEMSRTSFCDVHGTRLLLRAQDTARVHGSELRVVVTAVAVLRILELSRNLGLVVRIYGDLDSARTAPVGRVPPGPDPATEPPPVCWLDGRRSA
jgi:anti-sigma B factor antagonist